MKKILTLTKVMLISTFADAFGSSKKRKIKNNFIGLFGVIAIYVILSISIYFAARDILQLFVQLGQVESVITLVFMGISIYTLALGIFTVPTVFYFSKDVEYLLSLPLKSTEILAAKLLTSYVNMLIGISFILIPFGISYQLIVSPPIYFLVFYFLSILIVPIIPMGISISLIILAFRFIPKVNNKDLFTYISSVLLIALVIGMNLIPISDTNILQNLIAGDSTIQQTITILIPTINILSNAVNKGNILLLISALIISILFIVLIVKILGQAYFRGAIGIFEGGKKSKSKRTRKIRTNQRISSPVVTLIKADFRNILRTPVLLMNYLGPMFLLPIIMGIPGFMLFKSGEIPDELIQEVLILIQVTLDDFDLITTIPFVIIASFVLTFFIGTMTTITSTSISREGENITIYKAMPITMMQVINAKVLLGVIVTLIIPLFLLVSISIIFSLNIMIIAISFITILIAALFGTILDIILDTFFPKLVWDNETQAVKQNFLSIIPMLGSFLIISLFIYVFILLKNYYLITSIMILVLSILLTIFIYEYVIKRYGLKRLDHAIEQL